MSERLRTERVTVGYGTEPVLRELGLAIPDGGLTVIVGPNACGKSTLLRALARLLVPRAGTVLLDGRSISQYPTREVARRLGLLPQTSIAPEGITVAELVARGRHPHQGVWRRWSAHDEQVVAEAMAVTGVESLSRSRVDELSGGQRQRVWLAMALAQQTPVLLLDEPTTYLDIAHQIELMELLTTLQASGITIVAVLHDLNHAARYASHLVAMRDGSVVAQGEPDHIVTAELVEQIFDLPCVVVPDPVTGTPAVFPVGAGARSGRAGTAAV